MFTFYEKDKYMHYQIKMKAIKSFIQLVASLLLIGLVSLNLAGCADNKEADAAKKPDLKKNEMSENNSFENYKKRHNLTSDRFEDYKTTYKDGRKSEIRTMLTYEGYDETLAFNTKNDASDKTKVLLLVIEWNKNEGVVATESEAFSNQDDNLMFGGDVESNRRIAPTAGKFIQLAQQYLDENQAKLTKIDAVPNRDVDTVSFDFVTNKGTFTVQEKLEKLENKTSFWSAFFAEGKKLKFETEKVVDRFR
jgi:hypothetical protein